MTTGSSTSHCSPNVITKHAAYGVLTPQHLQQGVVQTFKYLGKLRYKNLRGLSLRANYTDRATYACQRS
jgi:hypothetical protein